MKRCAILTMENLDEFEVYDELFYPHLTALGWQVSEVPWRDQSVNWNDFDVVLIRSPWDYQDDADAFMDTLQRIEESNAKLENSLNIVTWNINKKYLKDLQQKGVNIVPTLWFDEYNKDAIAQAFTHFNVDEIVVKPCVSANADNTFRLTKGLFEQSSTALSETFAARDFMVQPFVKNVVEEGEYSCFYFNGEYSHTILKTPKKNDFRVQEEHGGSLASVSPEAKLKQQASHALAQISESLAYARLDFVRMGDCFAMMEAELIEPSLYFNMDEQSAKRFAQAFDKRMQTMHNIS
ncbi:ATP-grasp domain-containing protein [Thalassotalea agarivorans]|uniref:Prokaryotic glutathione synthetase ATP-binding domain-containing protein n=1 Tax=Thalassotalea agarivorans TaxID=349064 RepID=A0A1I0C253_THASX|nr:hypothetical protein [Thalassotalea agarivorans]SET12836.1 hypothetical protein SAMN05660429_01119 [Thalassotalea agarivorans]